MSNTPPELKYASSHEWARAEDDGTVTVGISDHAQDALGDVVIVRLAVQVAVRFALVGDHIEIEIGAAAGVDVALVDRAIRVAVWIEKQLAGVGQQVEVTVAEALALSTTL